MDDISTIRKMTELAHAGSRMVQCSELRRQCREIADLGHEHLTPRQPTELELRAALERIAQMAPAGSGVETIAREALR